MILNNNITLFTLLFLLDIFVVKIKLKQTKLVKRTSLALFHSPINGTKCTLSMIFSPDKQS